MDSTKMTRALRMYYFDKEEATAAMQRALLQSWRGTITTDSCSMSSPALRQPGARPRSANEPPIF